MTQKTYVGVDWSSGAWLAVVYTRDGLHSVTVLKEIGDIWGRYEDSAERIVADVPIGLCDPVEREATKCEDTDGELSRRCDDLARGVIKSRSSSVFTTPSREATRLAADDETPYEAVNARNRAVTGKGLMRQAANIAPGIVEVEDLLLEEDIDTETLVEGHPEVCFRAFNGKPLSHSKKYAAGVYERLQALQTVDEYEASHWEEILEVVYDADYQVTVDDVLDATALALTAAAPDGEFWRLPIHPPTDRQGLPMQMVYRADVPFDST